MPMVIKLKKNPQRPPLRSRLATATEDVADPAVRAPIALDVVAPAVVLDVVARMALATDAAVPVDRMAIVPSAEDRTVPNVVDQMEHGMAVADQVAPVDRAGRGLIAHDAVDQAVAPDEVDPKAHATDVADPVDRMAIKVHAADQAEIALSVADPTVVQDEADPMALAMDVAVPADRVDRADRMVIAHDAAGQTAVPDAVARKAHVTVVAVRAVQDLVGQPILKHLSNEP